MTNNFKYSLSEMIVKNGTGYHPLPQEMEISKIVADIEKNGYAVKVEKGINNKAGFTFTLAN
jgi:DNA/RNA endonuclease YhcR with UshA esterase domain